MYDVSAAFIEALGSPHGTATRVDLMYDGAVTVPDIPITGGSVTVDALSDTRRSLSLTVPDPSVFPLIETDPYSVYGQEVYVQWGVVFPDGSSEMVPLGFFVITDIGGDVHTGPLDIKAAGREFRPRMQAFPFGATTGIATSASAFISAKLVEAVPTASFVDLSTNGTYELPFTTWDAGHNRWEALQEVATAIGCELYCGAEGSFILRDLRTTNTPFDVFDWNVAAGTSGVLVAADRHITSQDVVNQVVVIGDNAAEDTDPVFGFAAITDPADPRHRNGPFGLRQKVVTSSLVTSSVQAEGMARSILRAYSSPNRTTTISAVPNGALDTGDVIRVGYGRGHDPELYVARSFTVPLTVDGGAMQIETLNGRDFGDE